MNTLSKLFFFVFLSFFIIEKTFAQNRTKINFGSNWEFKTEESGSNWEKINLPHTAKIEDLVVIDQYQGIYNYQKKFKVKDTKNQKIFLYFEGVMMETDVFLNGQKITNHKGGYLPFTVDITSFIIPKKENILKLKVTNVDNPEIPPGKPLKDLDFNYYGGIYRNVYLITTQKLYITDAVNANKKGSGGVLVNFNEISKKEASGTVQVHLKNEFDEDKTGHLKYILTDDKGEKLEFKSKNFTIKPHSEISLSENLLVANPNLWSISTPNLYKLEVLVYSGSKIIDNYVEKMGIRKSEIREDGFYLNDEKMYISGTNRHQEYPYLGYAISDEAQYRDAVKIKNAGFDLVRLSHYPQAEAFLNACDELGILVMNSLAGWQFFGNENFQNNSLQNLRDMVRRDRNHPSIVFWENSLNETGMTESFMKNACEVLDEELPLQNFISASWIDNEHYDLFIPARQHAKAPDYWTKYQKGNRKIFIAEYGDWEYYAQNAGFNQKDFANLKEEERTSRQLRGFGEKRLLQQAFNFQEAANSNRRGNNTIGDANWLMFDYNRGYSPDIESSGISDIFRIPKFAHYFYQSQRDADVKLDKKLISGPMVHIASYWTENSPLEVTVYSNCDEVALYLNEVLVAKEKPLINNYSDQLNHAPLLFKFDKFVSGTLRADGLINGEKVTSHKVTSPEKEHQIELTYDISSKPINPDFPDVVFVYAKITDINGALMPTATNEVTFTLTGGNAALIGENPVKAEAGIASILLRTNDLKKPISITAKSGELQKTQIFISKK